MSKWSNLVTISLALVAALAQRPASARHAQAAQDAAASEARAQQGDPDDPGAMSDAELMNKYKRDVAERKKEYRSAVDAEAKALAMERAKKLSWIYMHGVAHGIFNLGRLYLGTGFETRPACEEGRPCIPHSNLRFGLEAYITIAQVIDVVGRFGGVMWLTNDADRRFGMDVTAGLRYNIGGLFPVMVGWNMTSISFARVDASGGVEIGATATSWDHSLFVSGGVSFKGSTLEVGATLGPKDVYALRGDPMRTWSVAPFVMLSTPPFFGF